jgi:hypothetical protein
VKATISNIGELSADGAWVEVEKSGFTRIPTQSFSRFDIAAPFGGSLYVSALRNEKRNMLLSVN